MSGNDAKTFKWPVPEPFDGEADGKIATKAREFISKLDSYYRHNAKQFINEADKCEFALIRCEKTAYHWASTYLDQITLEQEERNPTIHKGLTSWRTWKEQFIAQFSSINVEQAALRELELLRYAGKIAQFTAEFRRITNQISWDEKARKDKFKSKLPLFIQESLARTPSSNQPSDVEEFYNYVIELGEQMEQFQTIRRSTDQTRGSFNRGRGGFRRGSFQPRPGYEPRPNLYQGNTRFNISREEYNKRREVKRCFRCNKEGHFANDPKFHPRGSEGGGSNNPATGSNAIPVTRKNASATYPEEQTANSASRSGNRFAGIEDVPDDGSDYDHNISSTTWKPKWKEAEDALDWRKGKDRA